MEAGIAVLFFGIFALAVAGRLRFVAIPTFVWLGAISYPLYVVHRNMGYLTLFRLNELGVPSVAAVAIAILGALAMASALTLLVERPSLRFLRGRYAKLRSEAQRGTQTAGA